MPEHSILTPEKERTEQEQRAVAVTAGGAATVHNGRNIRLIIGREYKNRVTQRSFIISSIVIMALVVIAAFVPTVIQLIASHSNSQTKIVVVNNAGPIAGLSNDALAQSIGATLNGTANSTSGTNTTGQSTSGTPPFAISVQTTNSLSSLQNQVKNGSLNILLALKRSANSDLRFTYYTSTSALSGDTNLSRIQTVAQQLNFLDTAHRLGLTRLKRAVCSHSRASRL